MTQTGKCWLFIYYIYKSAALGINKNNYPTFNQIDIIFSLFWRYTILIYFLFGTAKTSLFIFVDKFSKLHILLSFLLYFFFLLYAWSTNIIEHCVMSLWNNNCNHIIYVVVDACLCTLYVIESNLTIWRIWKRTFSIK